VPTILSGPRPADGSRGIDSNPEPWAVALRFDSVSIRDQGRARPSYSCPSSTIYSAVVGETMAELVAAVPSILAADQAEPRYNEAIETAVAACADDTAGQTCYICMDGPAEEGLVRGCSCRGASGFAHVSCLARQAEVAVERGAVGERFDRWHTCGLCEQKYHGVVRGALGWACWKTYLGRPETDWPRQGAINQLGNGLHHARQFEDALSVKEAELAMHRRVGASEETLLAVQSNLASTYGESGQHEKALQMKRDVYSGRLRLNGEEQEYTLAAACNYADTLHRLERFGEAKSLMRKTMPVARRVIGDLCKDVTLKMRKIYGLALHRDPNATLDDTREAVNELEETERIARRVLGDAHPFTVDIEAVLRNAREALAARETPSARLEEALARVDRLERELVEARRQVAELRRTAALAARETPPPGSA
jgi:hypothetical protein